MKVMIRLLMLILLVRIVSSCYEAKDSYQGSSHDPSKPVVINMFSPDSGGIRTSIVIEGENFGLDTSKIKFYFGKKRATLMGLNGEAAFVQMPKQPGDTSYLSIVMGGDTIVYDEQTFKYRIRATVSTVTGKAKESGDKDGGLHEATFSGVWFIEVDDYNNIMIVESGRLRTRFISLNEQKVVTLYTSPVRLCPPYASSDGVFYNVYYNTSCNAYRFDPLVGYVPEQIGSLEEGYWYVSVTEIPQLPNHLIVFRSDGNLAKMPKEGITAGSVELLNSTINYEGDGLIKYNPINRYLYMFSHQRRAFYRAKVNDDGTVEQLMHYAGKLGGGYADGNVETAEFGTTYGGMDFDSQGNLYMADYGNHCIRKISLDGIVSTIAGQPGKSGYKDGDPLTEALFSSPAGLSIGKDDMIYLVEDGNTCIRKISIE